MPVGNRKNILYRLTLPVFGLRCRWRGVSCEPGEGAASPARDLSRAVERVFRRHHVVGGCVQVIRGGTLAERYAAGYADLALREAVTPGTLFRTASVAKMACALLVMRLQTRGLLDVHEDISALWGAPIRNPQHPDTPIPLCSLLSHTSGLMDSPLYFQSFGRAVTVDEILADGACFTTREPGQRFQYSNFAAGLVGCLLERRFGVSLATLAQRELFDPLEARATFDLASLVGTPPASSYRVLPPSRRPAFDAPRRLRDARPILAPDPQRHYLLASGSLFLTAEALARLALPVVNGGHAARGVFLSLEAVSHMKTPSTAWPEPEVRMRHGMGLLEVDDRKVSKNRLYGHQGFAYGAVNGVFLDERGSGFASLNSGASEQRLGHLSLLNRDLIDLLLNGDGYA
ncbi:MAG: beta-lactamase family protein [Clostridiales bacterium]|nr:beta-lactamase family protein [Clostridiales bacterium]